MKNSSPKKSKKIVKFIVFILLVILLAVLIKINYTDAQKKIALENTIADMTSLNSKQTFSIDKIYLYSSANATNNKTKKYIRMVMGVYIVFNIISPFVKSKEIFNVNDIDINAYKSTETSSEVDQTSMNDRIEKLYKQELGKDIKNKINEKGYEVDKCEVNVKIAENEEQTQITKIKLSIKKSEEANTQNQKDKSIENKVVTEIQKINPININSKNENSKEKSKSKSTVSNSEIQNIKKFLIEEYGVNEKCLEIN